LISRTLQALHRRTHPGFLWAGLCVLALCAAGWVAPLLGVLGYELAAGAALLLFCAGAAWGVGAARRCGPPRLGPLREVRGTPWRDLNGRLALRLRGGLFLAALPVAACLARQVLGQGCKVHTGLALYAVMVLPALLLGLALGALCGALCRKRWTAAGLVVLFLLVSVSWTVAEGMAGPRAVLHHLVLGSVTPSGYTGYDEALGLPATLVRHRAFTLVLTWLLWASAGWLLARRRARTDLEERLEREVRRDRRRFGRLAAVALLACVPFALAPGASGLGSGQGRLETALSVVESTPHVRLHHAPGGAAEPLAHRIAWTSEWWVRNLSARLGIRPFTVDVWLYDDARRQGSLTGARGFIFAKPWQRSLHLHAVRGRVRSLDHELVHVLAAEFGPPPFRASWLPGMTEGLAVALAGRMDREPAAHARAAAALAAGDLPDVEGFLGLRAFGGSGMGRSYAAAGSFCGWLLMAHGPAPVREAYRTGDLEEAFGEPLADLQDGWFAFLETVPFDAGDAERATQRFSPALNRPFFATHCPRVGSLRAEDRLAALGWRLYRTGRREAAAGCFAAYGARDPQRRGGILWRAGKIWSAAGDSRGPALLQLIAEGEAPEARWALNTLYRGALRDGDPASALQVVERLEEREFLAGEEAEVLRARAGREGPAGSLQGPGAPGPMALAWVLDPMAGRALTLDERRELAERLAASGTMPVTARRTLRALAGKEMAAGGLEAARGHLLMLLELGPEAREAGEVHDLLDLIAFLEEAPAGEAGPPDVSLLQWPTL